MWCPWVTKETIILNSEKIDSERKQINNNQRDLTVPRKGGRLKASNQNAHRGKKKPARDWTTSNENQNKEAEKQGLPFKRVRLFSRNRPCHGDKNIGGAHWELGNFLSLLISFI